MTTGSKVRKFGRRGLIGVLVATVVGALLLSWALARPAPLALPSQSEMPGKTVWLLWMQGWDKAPWLAWQARASWEQLNPTWKVACLDENSVTDFVELSMPANADSSIKSGIIRAHLLAQRGGVWADATAFCLVPLDAWVYEALEPAGFWAFRGPRGPSSWFMVSLRGHVLAREWAEAAVKAAATSCSTSDNWMEDLFLGLVARDAAFASTWAQVPGLISPERAQVLLTGRCSCHDPALEELLSAHWPYVLKLTDCEDAESAKHNSGAVLVARLAREVAAPWPRYSWSEVPAPTLARHVVVASDCGLHDEVAHLAKICHEFGHDLMVFDKCNFGARTPEGVWRRPLANVGRDMHVYLHFVHTYYEQLPDVVVFTSTNLSKHEREQRLLALLESSRRICDTSRLAGMENFSLDDYEGTPLVPSSIRPFRAWFERHIAAWNPADVGPCWNGLMRTTRHKLQQHSRDFYAQLRSELAASNSTEVGHFVERAMVQVFAASELDD